MKTSEVKDHTKCRQMLLSITDAMAVLNGKWKLPILITLSSGNKRFSEITRQIPKITDRMLSKELRELEANELIKRTVYDAIPAIVEYSITDYGASLDNVILELYKWGSAHRKRIMKKA